MANLMKHFSLKHTRFLGNEKGVLTQFRLLWAALNKFDDDHGFFLSAGITFNFLICLIPLALLLLALLGTYLYSDREVLDHVRRYLENVIPSLDPTIMKSMLRIMRDRKIVGIFGIAGLIWTSTWVFSSLRTALNIVFQVEKGRSIVRGKAVDLFMIFLAGVFLLVSMTLTSAITIIQGYRFQSFINIGPIIHWVLKYLLPFFFTYWMFFLVYKIVPNKKVSFKRCCPGCLFYQHFVGSSQAVIWLVRLAHRKVFYGLRFVKRCCHIFPLDLLLIRHAHSGRGRRLFIG